MIFLTCKRFYENQSCNALREKRHRNPDMCQVFKLSFILFYVSPVVILNIYNTSLTTQPFFVQENDNYVNRRWYITRMKERKTANKYDTRKYFSIQINKIMC